jgi:membrane carboxypeptidase/penicillin-binding protein
MRRLARIAVAASLAIVAVSGTALWLWLRRDLQSLHSMIVAAEQAHLDMRVVRAVVAVVDPQHFERHELTFAGLMNVRDQRCAPTLTARFVLLALQRPERPILRLVRETLLFHVIALRYTPVQVARAYASNLYLGKPAGRPVFGIEAAAHDSFGRAPSELTPYQLASLIAAIGQPSRPPSFRRRLYVLEQLRRHDVITASEFERAIHEAGQAAGDPPATSSSRAARS